MTQQSNSQERSQEGTQQRAQKRPAAYTPALGEELLERLSDGSPLCRIQRDPGMPTRLTLRRWRRRQAPFAAEYTDAREDLIEALADQALERAIEATSVVEATTSRSLMTVITKYAAVYAPRKPAGRYAGPPPELHRSPARETVAEGMARAERMHEAMVKRGEIAP